MNAFWIVVGVVALYAIAYRYYSAFVAARVLALDPDRECPSKARFDGQNFVPTHKWVLFGHHFAAITGAGPLIGPVLAAQFGFLPSLLWLIIGVCLGGAVHDFVIMVASVRRGGKSLPEIAREEIHPAVGAVAGLAILFIVVVALAGLGVVVVKALAGSPWGTFTIACTIPIALAMGVWMQRGGHGAILPASAAGVVALLAAVFVGGLVPGSPLAAAFTFDARQITLLLAVYGLIASVLPVWLLLAPRDYLSAYMKLGTVGLLFIAVVIVQPTLQMPALTQWVHGGGPLVPGPLYPFVFITVACGAISGFHALVASGTTSKMLSSEAHARPIAYGSMLLESAVGVLALIAATILPQGDYFAINLPPEVFEKFGMKTENLASITVAVGEESLAGRTGGGVTLAVGMAQILSSLPGLKAMMAYWYHFAIMFEALFILTTIDAGTRVARFILAEYVGAVWKPFARHDWLPGNLIASSLVVAGWSWFILTGSIQQIWPMFGVANQLLAGIALAVGTTVIVRSGRARYAWVTLVPFGFVFVTTQVAGVQLIFGNFLPSGTLVGRVDAGLTAVMIVAAWVVLIGAVRACLPTDVARASLPAS
ncbi:MAG: carbon starvation protein A [Candidatus Sericytochromatia bacterium]|nr:carbon starvation protein A [Candidatus Tanganyikabacteria bacterium]